MEYFFADYNWIENQISSYESALNALGVTHVCYISRGGMFPAFLAAYILGIGQIHPLFYDRQSRTVAFPDEALIGPDSVVLLCEDKCGEGNTMQDCLAYAKRVTRHIKTLVVYYFKGSRIQPDFGLYVGDTMVVLPWERYVWTPEFKQDYNQGRIKQEGLDKVYLKYGAELDDIFIARHKDSNFPSLSEDILSGGLAALVPSYSASATKLPVDCGLW